ncbi:hypothetical protein HDU81_001301 [Chytriomyces hyalinus]|nr:hypothetical protein HDU81_001301 [Chytriomyces hyalinus]
MVGGLWLVLPLSYQTAVARVLAAQVRSITAGDFMPAEYKQVKKRLPTSISLWTAVNDIRLDSCSLADNLPDIFGDLKNLTNLRLWNNSLTGELPSSLNLLSCLQHLKLSSNQLSGEFPPLPNLNALETVSISRNCFTGPLPTVFGNSKKLQYFCADHNRFNVIPESISQLTSLRGLRISSNPFSCEMPSEILNLTRLEELEMSGCDMFGSLAGVGNLRNLGALDVSNNQFSGAFPSNEILNMHELYELHLVRNEFAGGEILDLSRRNCRIKMCLDGDFQRKCVVRGGFHKCLDHSVAPHTRDVSDSEYESGVEFE